MQSHLKRYFRFILFISHNPNTHAEVIDRVKQGKTSNFRKDIYTVDCNFSGEKKKLPSYLKMIGNQQISFVTNAQKNITDMPPGIRAISILKTEAMEVIILQINNFFFFFDQ